MPRTLVALVALLMLVPAAAQARAGDPDRAFAQRGTLTLKATGADAAGGAVKVIAGHKVLAGGVAAGQLVIVRVRKSGSLDSGFGTAGQVVPTLPGFSLDGVRSIATFRDGRIVVAGTLVPASGPSRIVLLRLLPNGGIDPSFGGGNGFELVGPANASLGQMVMDKAGNIIVAGGLPTAAGGESPFVLRFGPDGAPDTTFAGAGAFNAAGLGLAGRATGVLVRADGTIVFCIGAGANRVGPATFSVVRLLANGAPDPGFNGTGVVSLPLTPFTGQGAGAAAIHSGPGSSVLVAGSDVTQKGTLRGVVLQLTGAGALDRHFGSGGIARIARAGRNLRVTALGRDARGRVILAGTGDPPDSLLVRFRASGRRDSTFGNGGLTYPKLGRPPGGSPVYTTLDAIDADGSKLVLAGSAAGPGDLTRSLGGPTTFSGRFALTLSRLAG